MATAGHPRLFLILSAVDADKWESATAFLTVRFLDLYPYNWAGWASVVMDTERSSHGLYGPGEEMEDHERGTAVEKHPPPPTYILA